VHVNDPSLSSGSPSSRISLLILRIAVIAGTLDIADALIFSGLRGVSPSQVFHYIASGLLGIKAFEMGGAAVLLGIAIHYTIALGWTVIFYAASRKFAILLRRPVVSGLLYGIVVYVMMNFVVLPLTGVPHSNKTISLASRVNGVLALMLCIGLTIALLLRRDAARVDATLR
jgi:uncharacterized membrane protein YagU involved in acid resistance